MDTKGRVTGCLIAHVVDLMAQTQVKENVLNVFNMYLFLSVTQDDEI